MLAAVAAGLIAQTPVPAQAAGFTVNANVGSWVFYPDRVYAGTGDTVVWTNWDSAQGSSHTVTADDGSFNSGPIPPGGTFSHTFTTAGTFRVHDALWCCPSPYSGQEVIIQSSNEVPGILVSDSLGGGGSPCRFKVQLTRPVADQVIVAYKTVDGTAMAGSDYKSAKGTLRFGAGQTIATIEVATVRYAIGEPRTETFSLVLSSPMNATIVDNTGSCTISLDV